MIKIAIVEDESIAAGFRICPGQCGDMARHLTSRYTRTGRYVHRSRAQFDIISMDVQMKFMDGMSAAEECKDRQRGCHYLYYEYGAVCDTVVTQSTRLDYVFKPVSYFAF